MSKNNYVLGLKKKYEGELLLKKQQLETYFTKDVAIGEHPDIPEEQDKLLEEASAIQDKLEFLNNHFNEDGTIKA